MSSVNSTAKIITADPKVAAKYRADGWWSDERHADRIRKLAAERPNDPAYITETACFTWNDYDQASERVAAALLELGLERGDRVAVVLPDGPAVHAALVGVEVVLVKDERRRERVRDELARWGAWLLETTKARGLLTPKQYMPWMNDQRAVGDAFIMPGRIWSSGDGPGDLIIARKVSRCAGGTTAR